MSKSSDSLKRLLREKLIDLGRISFHELAVLVLFLMLVLLWFMRDPQFMPGWGQLFYGG